MLDRRSRPRRARDTGATDTHGARGARATTARARSAAEATRANAVSSAARATTDSALDHNAAAMFVAVVEHHSFRGAAVALGVPRSTVSLKIAQLEDALGTRLLERTTRTLRLTDAGAAYHRQASPAIDALREAAAAVLDLRRRPAGRLRLTTATNFGQRVLPAVLDDYLRRYPDVEVHVELCERHVDLIEEGFDLAIRAGALPDSTLIARPLPTTTPRIYASPAYLARHGEPRRPEQLRDHNCLVMTGHRRPTQWALQRDGRAITIEVSGRLHLNSIDILAALAIAGQGIVRLPDAVGDSLVATGALRRILDRFAPPAQPWHAVYPSARNLSPKVRSFVELLEHHLRRAADAHGALRAPPPRSRSRG